jgi:hypothetical protein
MSEFDPQNLVELDPWLIVRARAEVEASVHRLSDHIDDLEVVRAMGTDAVNFVIDQILAARRRRAS